MSTRHGPPLGGGVGIAELTPIVCAAFRERHPDVRLIVRTLPYAESPDATRDDRVDASFCLADTVGDRARFTAVYDDPPVLLARTADALGGASSLASTDVLNSLRNGEPARELALPTPDNLADLVLQIVDHGAVIATNASIARFVASPAVTFIPLTDSPAFTFGVASGHTDSDLQNSLVDLATGMARTDLDAIAIARPIAA